MFPELSYRRQSRRGFTLIELLIVISIIMIIMLFAVPALTKALSSARETSAIKSITTLHTAEQMYMTLHNRYAVSLQELGPPAAGGTDSVEAANVISRDLAQGEKDGYKFTLQTSPSGYTVSAVPTSTQSGSRSFYSDESMAIHQHPGLQPASASDPIVGEKLQQQTK
jgi:type IV pilus assembly protein PilA